MKRVRHGSPPLKWSWKLKKDAQEWANKLAAIDTVEPDPDAKLQKKEGENLGWIAPAKPRCTYEGQEDCYTCANIVDHWYEEINNYDFEKGMSSNEKPVHHFVQVNNKIHRKRKVFQDHLKKRMFMSCQPTSVFS